MSRSLITVGIDEYLFGLDVHLIREVNRSVDITPVALAPAFLAGLMNLRGQIISVIDPGTQLGFDKRSISESTRCVVLKTAAEGSPLQLTDLTGVLFDSVGDIVTISDDTAEPIPPNISEIDTQFITGVVRLDGSLLILLNLNSVLKNTF